MRRLTLCLAGAWLCLAVGLGWWLSQRAVAAELADLTASAEYEAENTERVVNRLFIETTSVANMVARQGQVIALATRYRTDSPDAAGLTRQERAARFTRDPLVRRVGDFMNALSGDLHYARIYMNNLSDDTVTASNWAEPDSIVGMIYSGRTYLTDALRDGTGHSFGIARLNKTRSFFVTSRIEDADDVPQGSVTVKFDAPEMERYLTGRHIALIVDRQGRVTAASNAVFALRNAAALLPSGATTPLAGDEDPGQPLDIRAMADRGPAGRWFIEGKPYLLQHRPLANTQYQLLTLATLDYLEPMRRQHLAMVLLAAALGLVVILLSCHTAGQMMLRRQDERHAANHDALTGLPNRRAVLAQLDRLSALAERTQQWVLVAFIDLDGFKAINDTYGHAVGDKFLIEVGRRISAGLRVSDRLGRLGGDEFVVTGLVAPPGPNGPHEAIQAMRGRLAPLLAGTYVFAECSFDYLGASLGIASFDPSVSSWQTALKDADRLMYADKQARRARQAGDTVFGL